MSNEGDKPIRLDTVVVSTQHDSDASQQTIYDNILRHVVRPVIDENLIDKNTRFLINLIGGFVIGGPQGDSGLTDECEVQLAYAIGVFRSVSISIDTFSTGIVPDEKTSLPYANFKDFNELPFSELPFNSKIKNDTMDT